MKISLNWLKEFVDITLTPQEVAHRLTMAGMEVKGVKIQGENWDNIVVGQIVDITPHPNADRLRLATVDCGIGPQTVVCGAPNLVIGDKIAFASVGARLVDPRTGDVATLKKAKIRGVASAGMICSEKELGLSESHEGIMVLATETTEGTPLADVLGDVILDLDITPNRPDCLSVLGIAREIAALTSQKLPVSQISYQETGEPIGEQMAVEIIDPELCPRYSASLITGLKVASSPEWLKQRLLDYGMRPINNVVDITNYVMIEYGQPLHAFDNQKLRGGRIIVRRARDGEPITTLDGVARHLSSEMLVITDTAGAVAIAGVMGGAASEVSPVTTSVLLEAANFDPANIHHTGDALRLPSEARMRFERGIRPELAPIALKRATQLILEIAGGKAARDIIDVFPGKVAPQPVSLKATKLKQLLGLECSLEQIVDALTVLGFECQTDPQAGEVHAIPPYWRSDISRDVDLIEEVARIIGYDEIPMTLLSQPIPSQTTEPMVPLKTRVRDSMIGYGFQEIITYSLTGLSIQQKLLSDGGADDLAALKMANPMTLEQEYLRPNLWASLLNTLDSNRRHESGGIRLFELGKVYLPRPDDLPDEPEVLAGLLSGPRHDESWLKEDGAYDFYDAKGVIEGLLGRLGIEASFEAGSNATLHPERQAALVVGGDHLGAIGELHPKVAEAFEFTDNVALLEINLARLIPHLEGIALYEPVPRFPAVARDLALLVDDAVSHARIQAIIKGFPLVTQVMLFDVYSGKQVPAGKKSLAYKITFRSATATLTDNQVDGTLQKILKKLASELGASLRS